MITYHAENIMTEQLQFKFIRVKMEDKLNGISTYGN